MRRTTPTAWAHRAGWVVALTAPAVFLATGLAQSPPIPPKTLRSSRDQADMVLIPAGRVELGMDNAALRSLIRSLHQKFLSFFSDESPKRVEEQPSFYIDKFEVTNQEYGRFLQENPKQRKPKYWSYPQYNAPRQPVVGVGWPDAVAYANWAGKRLPTEEEWEKAARGSDGRIWPWGNQPAREDRERYNGRPTGRFLPANVGSYPRGNSPEGVADLAGNVWEMTSTRWHASAHVMKGGSYLNTDGEVRGSVRWGPSPDPEANGTTWLGFRCAMDLSAAAVAGSPSK